MNSFLVRRCTSRLLALAFALFTASSTALAATPAHERLPAIAHAYIDAVVGDDPIAATFLGLPGVDGTLLAPSEERRAARIARLRAWRAELDAVDLRGATLAEVDDAKLLRAQIRRRLDELLVRQHRPQGLRRAGAALVGVMFTQFLHLPIPGRDGATAADVTSAWADIVAASRRARRSSRPARSW